MCHTATLFDFSDRYGNFFFTPPQKGVRELFFPNLGKVPFSKSWYRGGGGEIRHDFVDFGGKKPFLRFFKNGQFKRILGKYDILQKFSAHKMDYTFLFFST